MFKKLIPLSMLLAALWGAAAGAQGERSRGGENSNRPRLVVVISIDQGMASYITRFSELYLPARSGRSVGGFRYLQTQGAWYPDCRYDQYRTVTAVGHAVLGTGAQPAVNGIVGNSWWDRAAKKSVYCCDDPNSKVVGARSGSRETPMSAANLLTTTVGDELELATGGRAKTVALALKDRGAILLAGHRADTVVWFDETNGDFVSSTYYCPTGTLPAWVTAVNEQRRPEKLRETPWTPSVSESVLKQYVWNPKGDMKPFSHARTGRDYTPWATSPAGNEFVLQAAQDAVKGEGLGQDDVPDILSMNLASNDYVGHRYGPDSAEVLDMSVQTDRQLSELFNFLDDTVPGGLQRVTIALSSDHGVVTVPELNAASNVPASRAISSAIRTAAEKSLDDAVAPADWIVSTENGELYFNDATVAANPTVSRSRLEEIVCEAVRSVRGVYLAVGKTAALTNRIPQISLAQRIPKNIHPVRSGDVFVILDPQWLAGSAPTGTGTSHGSPYPYDTNVPLLVCGAGVRRGGYRAPVSPAWLGSSLAHILGIPRPSGADEPLLPGISGLQD